MCHTHVHTLHLSQKTTCGVCFYHVGSECETQIVRLSGKCSYLLSHLTIQLFKTLVE